MQCISVHIINARKRTSQQRSYITTELANVHAPLKHKWQCKALKVMQYVKCCEITRHAI